MNREKFLDSLKVVMYGAESSFSNLNLVYFDDGWMRSFNNRMYISCPVGSSFSCQVDVKILDKVLSKMNDKNIRIRFKDEALFVEGKKSKLKLKALQGEEIPERFKELPEEDFSSLPKDFLKGLKLSHTSAAANDPAFGVLNGVCIKGDKIFACDNFRISEYQMEEKIEKSFVIPLKSAIDLLRSNLEMTKFLVEDNWVHFLDPEEKIILSSILLSGEYPIEKIQKVLNKKEWTDNVITLPEELSDSIGRANVLSSETLDNLPFITLKMNEGEMEITGEREFGEYYEKLDWKGFTSKKGVSIKASPDFLKEILKVTNKFRMTKDNSALLFSTDNFKHLVLSIVGD
jgi:hypothetical protein